MENQLLALLREEGNDIRPLYHNAAVPLEKLVGFFMREGGKPYRFYEVPRIQDELTELGVLHVRLIRMADRERLWEGLRHRREKQWILARVLPSFTTSVLRARGLREDHYVRVEMRDNALLLYNDIPEKTLRLEKAAFSAAYADEILLLTLYRGLDAQMKDCLWERRLFPPRRGESGDAGPGGGRPAGERVPAGWWICWGCTGCCAAGCGLIMDNTWIRISSAGRCPRSIGSMPGRDTPICGEGPTGIRRSCSAPWRIWMRR